MLNKNDLRALTDDIQLQELFLNILEGCMEFYQALDSKSGYTMDTNESGDVQLKMDVLSDRLFIEHLSANKNVGLVASEEQADVKKLNPEGKYGVCYDPVDGSSIVDANLSFGSVFGVYETDDFIGCKASELKLSVLVIYGPKIMVYAAAEKGVCEFLGNHSDLQLVDASVDLNAKKPIMAVGNLPYVLSEPGLDKYFRFLLDQKISMRYSGSLTVEIAHILSKRAGVFMYLVAAGKKKKLRLLYECGPLAYLVEKALGKSYDLNGSVLDVPVESLHQNIDFFLSDQVLYDKFLEYYG